MDDKIDMKNKHDKLKLARRHMTKEEKIRRIIEDRVSPFDSRWWSEKKEAIILRVKKREIKAKEASGLRKGKML